jgi:hypothetical protein
MTNRAISVGRKPNASTVESFIVQSMQDSYELLGRPYLYGAGASYCSRQNFLNSKAYETRAQVTPASQLYMGMGSGVEQAVVDGLTRKGRLFFNNLYVPPMDPKVSGKIDLVYLDQNDQITIGELKTCGNLPTKPKPIHEAQLMTYAAVGGYKRANLIYISRNVADNQGNVLIRAFELDLSEARLTSTLERIVLSQMAIDEGWLPDIPVTLRKSDCLYCQFKKFCWDDAPIAVDYSVLPTEVRDEKIKIVESRARQLYDERTKRYVASLRHIWRNIESDFLKRQIVAEIEASGEKF